MYVCMYEIYKHLFESGDLLIALCRYFEVIFRSTGDPYGLHNSRAIVSNDPQYQKETL